jgi:hypothetical protein
MKDPYSTSTSSEDRQEGPEGQQATPSEGVRLKGPSEASDRKVLDFSKAYEVHERSDGSEPLDLIRN